MQRTFILAVLAVLLFGGQVLAGIDAGKLIVRSKQQAEVASHVVVGHLRVFHPVAPSSGSEAPDGMSRYAAEFVVEETEKGTGIGPGTVIYPRFWSNKTLEQLETERLVPDCGDRKVDPLPGDLARIYVRLDQNDEFVADHPQGFYAVARGGGDGGDIGAGLIDQRLRTAGVLALGLLSGVTIGVLLGRRKRAEGRIVSPSARTTMGSSACDEPPAPVFIIHIPRRYWHHPDCPARMKGNLVHFINKLMYFDLTNHEEGQQGNHRQQRPQSPSQPDCFDSNHD